MKTLPEHLTDRWGRWVVPYAALWITLLVGGVIVVILALLGAEVYDDVVDDAGLAGLDKPALAFAEQLRSPALDSVVTAFTNVGGGIGMPILASILTAWLTYLARTWRALILVGGAAAFSITATTLSKRLVGRTRPDHADAVPPYESSPSFPSGHTLNTTVVIGVLVYVACLQVNRTVARVALITAGLIFVIAMGLSRVYLGHHWMTDVIAAWLLGLAWVGTVILAHRLFHALRHREHAGPAPTFDRPLAETAGAAGSGAAGSSAGDNRGVDNRAADSRTVDGAARGDAGADTTAAPRPTGGPPTGG
ncbi:phosphatase PAP2 family protein [Cypionkella sp.]|uniref:phosphatase PAP2 family protein n=1 Tax=Cypionkella sp. TaxID=2811411 RepID=UPI0026077343|nr:phosphatase PAP2 family protein [Cypionkella sp.]MDB5667048.1 phosphatase family protein [Cypionkella sp.]